MTTATQARAPLTIRRGGAGDLPKLVALFHESHPRMRFPYPVAWTVHVLRFALTFPVTHLLIVEDRVGLCGYCWAEVMVTGELLIHQVFLLPGRPARPLYDALVALATEHDCRAIVGLTYRRGGPRGFARWGFQPRAILVSKEVC
jgi:hypothetical protein